MEKESRRRRAGEEDHDESAMTLSAMGVSVGARGRDSVFATLAVSGVGLLLTAGWLHHAEMEAQNKQVSQQISEMIYVLSLSQESREALNISMPDSLRQKLQSRGRRAKETDQ